MEFHYGWEKYIVKNARSEKEAAYKATIHSHEFLTKDNHTKKFVSYNGYKHVNIIKNEKSDRWKLAPWWAFDGPGTTWISQHYCRRKTQIHDRHERYLDRDPIIIDGSLPVRKESVSHVRK